ncbi:type II secretion system F family protein [Candidatus Falkowbacteria bacterium]|nr:type II secretion system F family protein [Candidatus Falkowbacteria bacterium]
MPQYIYRAKKAETNELITGAVEAETEGLAAEILEEKGFRVLFLEEKKRSWAQLEIIIAGIKQKELVIFSRQLSILISAEVPLVEALRDVVNQTKNKKLKQTIAAVAAEVEGGVKFSDSLARYPDVFDDFFLNIIRSGELSGRLQEVLLYLADQMEKDYDLRSKIKGAMIYPIFVLASLVGIGVLMMMFVVPKLTDMLVQTGAQLPLATRIIKGTSDFLLGYWWLLIIFLAGAIIGSRFILKTADGRRAMDKFKLQLPVFGKLFHFMAIIKFSRSLRTLMLGGVDIVGGLEVVSKMMGNVVYENLVQETKKYVEGGGNLGDIFAKTEQVPKMLSQMLSTGEETGRIEPVLDKLSEFYTREVNNIVGNLMSLLEPFIMIVLGVAVAIMIMAIILPMYQISSGM